MVTHTRLPYSHQSYYNRATSTPTLLQLATSAYVPHYENLQSSLFTSEGRGITSRHINLHLPHNYNHSTEEDKTRPTCSNQN